MPAASPGTSRSGTSCSRTGRARLSPPPSLRPKRRARAAHSSDSIRSLRHRLALDLEVGGASVERVLPSRPFDRGVRIRVVDRQCEEEPAVVDAQVRIGHGLDPRRLPPFGLEVVRPGVRRLPAASDAHGHGERDADPISGGPRTLDPHEPLPVRLLSHGGGADRYRGARAPTWDADIQWEHTGAVGIHGDPDLFLDAVSTDLNAA